MNPVDETMEALAEAVEAVMTACGEPEDWQGETRAFLQKCKDAREKYKALLALVS